MAREAEARLEYEEKFFKKKKEKAREAMTKHWNDQIQAKNNEETVHRIFV